MRTPFAHWVLITLLVLAVAIPSPVFAQKKMLMQAAFNPAQTDQGVNVAITGRVFDTANSSISNAVISIQVNDPDGTSIHVAVAYTSPQGSFQDTFFIASNSPGGNYTAFLVADKPGYDTAKLTLTLAYSSPDFSIQPSATALSLRQGQTYAVSIMILSLRGFHDSVNLTALELPAGVTLRFNPPSIAPGGTITVNVAVSSFAAVGNYTITLVGVSGSVSHKVSLQVSVIPGPVQAVYLFTAIIAIIALAFLLFLRTRRKQRKKIAAVEELIKQASADRGYVATARVIARLEELRAMSSVDEATYQRLKKEYEKQLEKSK